MTVAVLSVAALGILAKVAPLHPHDVVFFVNYWGPLFIAGLLAAVILLVAMGGKIPSRRLAGGCLWLGAVALGGTVLIGVGRMTTWTAPTGCGPNFSLSYVRQRLPSLPDALHDGTWATAAILGELNRARSGYPADVRTIDQYIAAWHFWRRDPERGEAALWRLGMQTELIRCYEARRRWDLIEQMAQGTYLASVAEALPSGRVEAMKALARRGNRPEDMQGARRFLLEAFKQSGRLEVEEQDRLWQKITRGLGGDITWAEYYQCLQQLAMQAQTPEALGRLLFEMKKVEQLHPEVQALRGEIGPRTRG